MIIHGASFGKGAGKEGTEKALDVLIQNGLYSLFPRSEIKKIDHYVESPEEYLKRLYTIISQSYFEERFILNIGGDHSTAISTVFGACNHFKDISILYIDNHGDYNNLNSSITKNLHGMPLNCIINGSKTFNDKEFKWTNKGCINPNKVSLIGINNIDPEEKLLLIDSGIHLFWYDQVKEEGIEKVMKQALEKVENHNYHLSFDVDVINHNEFGSTGCYTEKGITFEDAKYAIKSVKDTGKLRSMDFVEFNPFLDVNQKHALLCLELLKQLL